MNGRLSWALAALAIGALPCAAQAQTVFPPLPPNGVVQDCGAPDASPDICRVLEAPTADELSTRLGDEAAVVWGDGDLFHVAARKSGDQAGVAGAIQAPMARTPGTDLWSLTVRVPRLNEAVIDVFVVPHFGPPQVLEWHGPLAEPTPMPDPDLEVNLVLEEIQSAAMGETRQVWVYLPPDHDPDGRYPVVYLADGEALPAYARVIEPAIRAGRVPPVVVVGLPSGASDDRAAIYLRGWRGSSARFDAHEAFLLTEVMPRVERLYGASDLPQERLLVGKSNGAAWALSTALRNPEVFGAAAPIALGYQNAATGVDRPGRPRLFMATGLFDPFVRTSRTVAEQAAASGDEVVFETPVTGHGNLFYQGLLDDILAWAFVR